MGSPSQSKLEKKNRMNINKHRKELHALSLLVWPPFSFKTYSIAVLIDLKNRIIVFRYLSQVITGLSVKSKNNMSNLKLNVERTKEDILDAECIRLWF